MKISAVVLTKNEEKNIKDCLETLAWCDEKVLVDDNSTDRTREIATRLGVKVYVHPLSNDFATQRNYGLEKATGEWVFFVDADERVTPELKKETLQVVAKKYDGYFLRRKDFLFGKWLNHGETANVKLLRLAKREVGKWERPIHEIWQVEGKLGELKNPLWHYSHQTIKEFLEDINFYTTLNAQVFYKEGLKVSWWQIIAYPLGKFIKNYFLNLGFLDGVAGLLQATFMSSHSFLTRAKLWHLWQKDATF